MKKKTYQLGVRMDEDLLARLRAFEEQTGISSSALARATLESALDYFETEREIVFPLCCVPRSKLDFFARPPRKTINLFCDKTPISSRGCQRRSRHFCLAPNSLFYRFGNAFNIRIRHPASGRQAEPAPEKVFGNAVPVECV